MTKANAPRLRFSGFNGAWEVKKIKDVFGYRRGSFPQPYGKKEWYDDNGFRFAQVIDINDNLMMNNDTKIHISDLAAKKSVIAKKGSILITIQGSIGRIALTTYDTYIDRTILLIDKYYYQVDKFFAIQLLKLVFHYKQMMAPGSTIKTITKTELSEFNIAMPEMTEQSKVGSFFAKIDKLIELQTKKLEQLKKLKRGYLQKMFPQYVESLPRLRFSGFNGEWKEEELGRLLIHNSIRNKNGNITNVESVSNKFGFIKQTDQFDDYSVASKDLSNYFVISPGMFAYNPSRINVGSIAYKYEGQSISIVSPLYVSFKTNKMIDDDFFLYWFKTEYFRRQREKYSEGGVRDTLSYNSLSEFNFMLPSLDEQHKIGLFLSKLDQMINNQSDKIKALQQEKKSYLQKMFI